ncbi:MAG: hypothetical protein K2P81_10975 [Bacteriovoracaceae bacterium]|nr:hypothetical protein [Bacteriovoracaceae bacterium]
MPTWLMQTQSFLIVALMIYGITQHKSRSKHVKIMLSAMIWDILLILQIELSRSAILKAAKALSNPAMLNIHVSIAVTTVIFYLFMFITGRKVLAGDNSFLKRHKRLGWITMSLRILTFATSFMAVSEQVNG